MTDEPSLNQRVAEEIRVMMARRNVNQTELAKRSGKTQRSISRIVTGEKAIDMDDLQAVAGALGCDVWDLMPRPAYRGESRSNRLTADSARRSDQPRSWSHIQPTHAAGQPTHRHHPTHGPSDGSATTPPNIRKARRPVRLHRGVAR